MNPSELLTAMFALVGLTATLATGRALTINSSLPIPFMPFDVVTAISYEPAVAMLAMLMFAISSVELTYWVEFVFTSGEGTPFCAHCALDPRSNPLP